jgi:hypothetical protein
MVDVFNIGKIIPADLQTENVCNLKRDLWLQLCHSKMKNTEPNSTKKMAGFDVAASYHCILTANI